MQRLRNLRTTVTLFTSSLLCVSAIGLAADQGLSTDPGRTDSKSDTARKDQDSRPAKGKAQSTPQRAGKSAVKDGKGNRFRLKPSGNGTKPGAEQEPYAAKKLLVDDKVGFQLDPVTGTGMLMSPDGVPVFITMRPNPAGTSWIGQAMGDERSDVWITSTKWGETGVVHSEVWGNWRFLPTQLGQITIRSLPPYSPGWCGTEDELLQPPVEQDVIALHADEGGLAGLLDNCWDDTDDQTVIGPDGVRPVPYWIDQNPNDLKGPGSNGIYVGRLGSNCLSEIQIDDSSADKPDYTIQDDDCDGFPTVDKVIDILYGYTQDALECFDNDVVSIQALAVSEMAKLNEIFINSQISVRARLVGVELGRQENGSPYRTKGGIPQDLETLYKASQVQWRGLENLFEDLRDERGADIVSLLVCDTPFGLLGQAANIPMEDYSVLGGALASPIPFLSSWNAHRAAFVYSVAGADGVTYQHELGHCVGASHGSPASVIESPGEGQVPCPEYDDECLLFPDALQLDIYRVPDEFHYGLRFFEVLDDTSGPTDQIYQTVMAYAPEVDDEQPPPRRVDYFSNPEVTLPGTLSAVGVQDDDGVCCVDDGENTANALVIERYMNAEINQPINQFPGIAQFRCNKIPYDCNQNGILDTEEIDQGLLPDLNNDRVPDGCLANPCFDDADVVAGAQLSGPGGLITDFSVVESQINIPFNAAENNSWVLQPREVIINSLQHTNLSDLQINLVHRQFGVDDTVWKLVGCDSLPSGSGILNGLYIFQAPLGVYSYDYLTTPLVCEVAADGGIGGSGVVPSGVYRSEEALTGKMENRTIGGAWILQIIDLSGGHTGQFLSWNLQFQLVPYDTDCDGDGLPDGCGELLSFITDCDEDGNSDACQIASQFNLTDNVPYNNPDVDEDGDGNALIDSRDTWVETRNMTVPILIDVDQNGTLDGCENTSFWLDMGGPATFDIDQYITYIPDGEVDPVTALRPRDGVIDASDVFYISSNFATSGSGPNGRADIHDILENPDLDKNRNFVIDALEIPGDCGFDANRTGCFDFACNTAVNAWVGPVDCDGDGQFDDLDGVEDNGDDDFLGSECNLTLWDECCVYVASQVCSSTAMQGNCGLAVRTGCSDPGCNAIVCIIDPTCCDTAWDANCVALADEECAGNSLCRFRDYDSADFGTTGVGRNTQNYDVVSSSIVVSTADTGDLTDVLPGATLYGAPEVTIYGLTHQSLQEIAIHLVHTSNGVTIEVPLIDYGCLNAPGVLVGDTIVFREFGAAKTVCEAATESGGPLTDGGVTTFSSAGPLSAFLGTGASGTWTLQVTDICCSGNGGFTGWDINFTHTPPDNNGNFISDICE